MVNSVSGAGLISLLKIEYSSLVVVDTPHLEAGEVLADARGRGTQQRVFVESRTR